MTDDRAGSIITGYPGDYAQGAAPAARDGSAEEVPLPPPIPDPGMQEAPEGEMQPMPPDGVEPQPSPYRPTPSPAVQRSRSYPPMTLRPQRQRLR